MTHQTSLGKTNTWLTPRWIIDALGGWRSFDLDPCAAPAPRPWQTARRMNAEADRDGLSIDWDGRVYLNPPYARSQIGVWMKRMADHGNGTALVFARTDARWFRDQVWPRAHGLLFLYGRLSFCRPDGATGKNGRTTAPSVLIAYGGQDMDRLAASNFEGQFVPLRLPEFMIVGAIPRTWRQEMVDFLERVGKPVTVSEAYRYFASHPKTRRNPNWRAKIRQQLQDCGKRIAPATYALPA